MNLLAKYNAALATNPLATKCATGAVLYAISDITAQLIQRRVNSEHELDLARTRKFALYGIGIAVPIFHCWYTHVLPRITIPCQIRNTAAKLLIDQTFFSAFAINVFFLSMAPINGRGIGDGYKKLKREFTSTMVASWKLWLPVQTINLSMVPVAYQVLSINMVSVMWNVYLSSKQNAVKEATVNTN